LEYSDGEEPIRCKAHLREGGWLLTIENRALHLTDDDLRHMRDPFWRKDAARSGTTHTGLGLSLVEAFCRLMNVGVHVELRTPETFCWRLTSAGGPPRTAGPDSSPSSSAQVPQIGYAHHT